MKRNQEVFDKLQSELNFNLTKEQHDYVLDQFNSFCDNLNHLENLDLSKYSHYNYATLAFNELREDVVEQSNNPRKHFNNSVNFENDYVVINDEKE